MSLIYIITSLASAALEVEGPVEEANYLVEANGDFLVDENGDFLIVAT